MTQQIISTILRSLGLNEKEVIIYLALLSIGHAPASTLAQRTGITRSTAQYTCNQLFKKGLFRQATRKGTYIYYPEPPEKLLFLLNREEREIEKKEKQIQRLKRDLKFLKNPEPYLPRVQFFEGVEGVINLMQDHLNFEGNIYGTFHISKDIDKRFAQFVMNEYLETRSKMKNNAWIIYMYNAYMKKYRNATMHRYPHTKGVYADADHYIFNSDFLVYGSKVAFYSFRVNGEMGVIIDNPDVVTSQKSIFKLAWNYLIRTDLNKKLKYKPL